MIEIIEFTMRIPLPVKRLLNLWATEIFRRSVIKYERITIEKNSTKLVKDFPLVGEDTIKTPPQKIKTPTFNMFKKNPLATSPK